MTQEAKILEYMRRKGDISAREALLDLNVASLSRRITELSRQLKGTNERIWSEWRTHEVTGQRYVRYHLVPRAEAA